MSEIRLVTITDTITLTELAEIAEGSFGDLVKAVVDIDQRRMAIGGELHADEEHILIEGGSKQPNLWGINLYPAEHGTENWLEYDSMINLRPSQKNRSRSVEDPKIREIIAEIVEQLVATND
ncbi:MAG TPA: DUF5674 family protein [Actinomycetota bacterium]|nr:DUF5674 family protein [Actinomycetota bacterium]